MSVENDEIISSKYTTYFKYSLFVLCFKTTKMLILGVCFILYYLKLSGKNSLASSDYWNLYWIKRLGAMWSYYGDEIADRIAKCLSNVLMSYHWEIEFSCRGSEIRDLIRNLQQNHSSLCDIINMCTINLFLFSNLIFWVSWLFDWEKGVFLHIKKPTCLRDEVVYLVTACKLNCGR